MSDAWPGGHGPRILLADAWLPNTGDAAITAASLGALRAELPEARVLVCANHTELAGPGYPELRLVPSLAELVAGGSPLPGEADAVISQGGGFLFEHYNSARRLEAHAEVLRLGTPLAFWAQSIGRYADPDSREQLRGVLEAAAIVVARDPETLANLDAMEIRPRRTGLSADVVLLLEPLRRAERGEHIGLILNATAPVPAAGSAVAPAADLFRRHVRLAERLAGVAPVRMFSTVQGFGELTDEIEDDSVHARAIRAALPWRRRRRIDVVDGFLPLGSFIARLDGLRSLVTMRLHAALIAMLHGVPAVYASENFKGVSLYERLGLGDLVVRASDPEPVLAALGRAERLAVELPERLEPLRREAASSVPEVLAAVGLAR